VSNQHTKREARAKLLAWKLAGAGPRRTDQDKQPACGDAKQEWVAAETEHAHAPTPLLAQAAADEVLWQCDDCPVKRLCRRWAKTDHYTGLAAGTAWVNGRPTDPQNTRSLERLRRAQQLSA